MTDTTTAPAGATLKLSEAQMNGIRTAWREAGGVIYSSPKGQQAAMVEPKLFAFLGGFLRYASESVGFAQGAPTATELSLRLDRVETELFHLVKAICPGLDSGDLIADAGVARAAMASAAPIAFFQCDTGEDGVKRYQNVQDEFQTDEDVFPLYRRAPTLDELKAALQAHADEHHLKSESAAPIASASVPKAAAKKAASK